LYPHSLGCGDNLETDEKAQERYWNQNRYYHYRNQDPSTQRHAETSTNEILDYLYDKIWKDISRFYETRSKSVVGQELRHAIIRELAFKLFQKVQQIDKFEQQNIGDLRTFTNSEDLKK
jgi:hypothetical protein